MMKTLSLLWQIFREGVALSNMTQETQWDPHKRVYVVGEPQRNVNDPTQRLVTDGDIPATWHQCYYFYESKDTVTRGNVYTRCLHLAGPGLKPTFCHLHAVQYKALHLIEEQEKRENATVIPPVNPVPKFRYCRYGPCTVQLFDDHGDQYCEHHMALLGKQTLVQAVKQTASDLAALIKDEEECGCYGYCDKHFNDGKPRTQADIDWDNIIEDVDWSYVQKIGWGQLRYRSKRKEVPLQAQETVHFKLELRGNRDSIDLFHAMLHLCDTDYPLDPFRKNTATPEQCKNCGGYVWKNALVTPVDIKKAAKQAGITVKVRHYFPESTCKKKDRAASA